MLINRIQEGETKGDGKCGTNNVSSYSYEYETANELFDLMTKEHSFNATGDDSLTTRDLVILYENIEIGTKLLSDAKQVNKSNQLVETVVYNDETESETSDNNLSNADLLNLCRANDETMDLLQSDSSFENTLCRKISKMDMETSIHGNDKYFLFKDPFTKDHLQNLRASCMDFDSQSLPSTLLDYLCCKRLEDNYTFNMDNIIRYVTHTIEQLKRISNGDYLTDKAKEMWKEVQDENVQTDCNPKSTKMLATRTRVPLHIERKITGTPGYWDDIVHSEIDIRSLSKLLEKKIFLEIPKIICGSFKLFSKQCADNLIIRCKQSCSVQNVEEDKTSQVDVVFQLERSETGQVVSNINSIMILDAIPKEYQEGTGVILALPSIGYDKSEDGIKIVDNISQSMNSEKITIEEENKSDSSTERDTTNSIYSGDKESMGSTIEDTYNKTSVNDNENAESEKSCKKYVKHAQQQDLDSSSHSGSKCNSAEMLRTTLKEAIDSQSNSTNELTHRSLVCDDLHLTMRSLVMPDTLPEETEESFSNSNKPKSPTRVRVKSPYENKSRIIEEKKRKKLLEIKERRDRKRNALNENNRITKHKFSNRSPIMPQASGSVTKLSISNKSFYNDIYGKKLELENKIHKTRYRKREHFTAVTHDEHDNNDYIKDIIQLPSKYNKKYINKDYSSDDSVSDTEITDSMSKSSLAVPNECETSLGLLKQHVQPSMVEIKERHTMQPLKTLDILDTVNSETSSDGLSCVNKTSNYKEKVTDTSSRITTTDDCRESIDKVYDLMNKLESSIPDKSDYCAAILKTKKSIDIEMTDIRNLTIHESESDSVKHPSVSSYPSNISIVKPVSKPRTRNIEPKVIINNKNQQSSREQSKTSRKNYNPHSSIVTPVDENPLKAISQLLHDIEHVQKKRKKTTFDPKVLKKTEDTQKENRYRLRFNIDSKRQADERPTADKYLNFNPNLPKAVPRTNLTMQSPRQLLKSAAEERHNLTKKKLSDFLDEVKEARGEAVRGPTKLNSRLNTLAQPKKSYVQAHNQEYQSRYGRSVASDRLLRLAAAERSSSIRSKQRRSGQESLSIKPSAPASSVTPLETVQRKRPRSRSPVHRTHGSAKIPQKQNVGRVSLIPKPTSVIESSIKSNYSHETSTKSLMQHSKLRDFNSSSRFQPPSLNLEYFEIKSNLTDGINTMISTIPIDYKKSEPDIKSNKSNLSLKKFIKKDSLIAEDGSFDEGEEQIYYQQSSPKLVSKDSELTKLETSVHSKDSSGVFRKRLRMKNLTLTPKQSSMHMMVLQTGDGSSVMLKSKISQNFQVNISKSEINYPLKSFSRYITKIPLQMFSVGYAFQQYRSFNAKLKREDYVQRKGSVVSFTSNFTPNPIQKQISDISTNAKANKLTEINDNCKSKKRNDSEIKYSTAASDVPSETINTKKVSCSDLSCITEGKHGTISKLIDEDVTLSTSLDILVELLGEIKNITTCQSQLSSQEYDNKEIKDIFNNISFKNKDVTTKDNIDVATSIQKDLNIFSQLNNDTQELCLRTFLPNEPQTAAACCKKVTLLDKEISVKLNEKEYVNRVTDIPSQLLQMNFSRSTSITNSLMRVCSRPSSYTMYSLSEDCSIHSCTSIESEIRSKMMPIKESDRQEKQLVKFEEIPKFDSKPSVIFKKNNCALLKSKSTVRRFKARQHIKINSSDMDSIMKLKRDVLVTVYSILVVTVFAALSLPQVV